MRHLDLFSGIGGFALAASRVWGNLHEILAFCEINEYCRRRLSTRWPGVPVVRDIRLMKGADYADVDLVTGGFPCQPFSIAGRRMGEADDRFLWPEMLRVIREARPRWILAENVPGIITLQSGMVLDRVLSDLETARFEVLPPLVVPACAAGAPHRRDRVWIVAHSRGERCKEIGEVLSREAAAPEHERPGLCESEQGGQRRKRPGDRSRADHWAQFEWLRGADGRIRRIEPGIRLLADGVPGRVAQLTAFGAAIVPQVAEKIMRAIRSTDESFHVSG